MDLTDATDIVFWDVPAPCRHTCPLLDLDLHAFGGGGLVWRQVSEGLQRHEQRNTAKE